MNGKSKLVVIRILSVILFVFYIFVTLETPEFREGSSSNEQRFLNTDSSEGRVKNAQKRPVIHTFFHYIDPSKKGTGMSVEADERLLALWKQEWSDAGWDPVVLSLEDAEKHPRFEEFKETLEKVPLMGKGGRGVNIFYNQLCYYRWLAMAAVGGGWMSDYDVFPVRHVDEGDHSDHNKAFLPGDGYFTVHAIVSGSAGSGIPCFMSGTADEWEKMAFNILDNGAAHQDERMWTDMFALMDLRHQNSKQEIFNWRDTVVPGQDVLLGHLWKKEECDIIDGREAVHFSHEAMLSKEESSNVRNLRYLKKNGGWSMSDRPALFKRWRRMYERVCLEREEN